jgi:hypothetical protein
MIKLSTFQQILLKLSHKKRLLVIGDSHTAVFSDPALHKLLSKDYRSFVQTVGGATISGLTNPNSKTNAKASFEGAFEQIKPHVVISQIGEVDTGFVIWYRAQKHQASVDSMLKQCIDNYRALLLDCAGLDKTIVISAPLPTIKDDQDWGEVANLRKEVKATMLERTALTIEFNNKIKKVTEELGIDFIDLDPESLGVNGVVVDYLLNDDSNDHHYCRKAYLSLLSKHLKAII